MSWLHAPVQTLFTLIIVDLVQGQGDACNGVIGTAATTQKSLATALRTDISCYSFRTLKKMNIFKFLLPFMAQRPKYRTFDQNFNFNLRRDHKKFSMNVTRMSR